MERPSDYLVTTNRTVNVNSSNAPKAMVFRDQQAVVLVGGIDGPPSQEFQRFEDLARKLVQVPKEEVDEQREES